MSNYTYSTKSFDQLTLHMLYDILKVRQEVFVVEQDCPYQDADDNDQNAMHVIATDEQGQLVGYTRVLAPGVTYPNYCSIGRVASVTSVRGQGVGQNIMQVSIDLCHTLYPQANIKISAQTYLSQFYKCMGFKPTGEYYLEDDIPHQGMIM